MKINIKLLEEQIHLIDTLAINASSEHECDLLDGIANLLSEIVWAAEEKESISFECDESYTAFVYENDGINVADESMYDNKQEAIEFAKARNWDEVVNDNTGKIVWHR